MKKRLRNELIESSESNESTETYKRHNTTPTPVLVNNELKYLVLCHGRTHTPEYTDKSKAVLVDFNPKSNPDVLESIDIKSPFKFKMRLANYLKIGYSQINNYFDVIELRHCPQNLYSTDSLSPEIPTKLWDVLYELLAQNGIILVYGPTKENWVYFFKNKLPMFHKVEQSYINPIKGEPQVSVITLYK